ncbi:M48 family metalloprotease [Candidatus Poriferisocius sp.]|uniref:M48 family metalloprotease n=1 Tax=Candidatus Poriferisocius sp. TaxID=3101276 RepID=UPI003B0181A3
MMVVLTLLGMSWLWAAILAVVVATACLIGLRFGAWRLLLRLTGSEPPNGPTQEVLANVLEGLCVSHGIAAPELRTIDSRSINALTTARTPNHAAIVVTTGAVEQLERIEMEGLLAHLLCRIRRGDAAFDTLAGVLLAWPLGAFGQLRVWVMNRVLPAARSLEADFEAVSLTRYPPGLLSALMTLSNQQAGVPSSSVAALHMWVDEPDWGASDTIRHPRMETRIAALNEL